MHLLSPTSPADIVPRIIEELKTAQRADGTIDIPTMLSLPLLNSAFQETLRMYVDLLVVRKASADTTLDEYKVKQGEMIMAPTWMTQRNPEHFSNPDNFVAERFLKHDAETGKIYCSTTGLGGKYFPFGGGHYMCPGRTFARQEVLGAVAMVLLKFEVKMIEFVREKNGSCIGRGRGAGGFPTLKKGYAGNNVVGLDGDMRVLIRRTGGLGQHA